MIVVERVNSENDIFNSSLGTGRVGFLKNSWRYAHHQTVLSELIIMIFSMFNLSTYFLCN